MIDFIILQQDSFDKVDQSTPVERQRYMLNHVLELSKTAFEFDNFNEVSMFFKRVINQYKQMNYSEFQSEKFNNFEEELNKIIAERKVA